MTGIDGASGPWPVGSPDAERLEGHAGSGFSDSPVPGMDGFDEPEGLAFGDPPEAGIDDILGPPPAGPEGAPSGTGPEDVLEASRVIPPRAAPSGAAPPRASWNASRPVVTPVPVTDADAADGGGGGAAQPQRQRIRDLSMDARMRIWRRRALIAVIAGVVFSIVLTWRLGLTIAVIVAIADTIYRSRTVASIPPGIKLSGAQRRTQRQLGRMERAGYRALHSRPIPNSKEYIDHLVIGPTGVYAIDSEDWDKRLPVRFWNGKQLFHGPESKKHRLTHARWEAEQASELLSGVLGREIAVRPAMAVYGPKIPWDIATIRNVDVFSGPRLRKYLRKRSRNRDLPRLSAEDVEKIQKAAAAVLPFAGSSAETTPVG